MHLDGPSSLVSLVFAPIKIDCFSLLFPDPDWIVQPPANHLDPHPAILILTDFLHFPLSLAIFLIHHLPSPRLSVPHNTVKMPGIRKPSTSPAYHPPTNHRTAPDAVEKLKGAFKNAFKKKFGKKPKTEPTAVAAAEKPTETAATPAATTTSPPAPAPSTAAPPTAPVTETKPTEPAAPAPAAVPEVKKPEAAVVAPAGMYLIYGVDLCKLSGR